MKRIALLALISFFLFFANTPCQAGKLRKEWQGTKNAAEKALKKAKLKKLDAYVKFNQALGPQLDKLEKMTKKVPIKLRAEKIQKNKKIAKLFSDYCKKEYSEENWLAFNDLNSKKPEDFYGKYIKAGSKLEINIPSEVRKKWDACVKKGDCKKVPKLYDDTNKEIVKNLDDTISRFTPVFEKAYKKKSAKPMRDKIFEIIKDYDSQVDKMDKKASPAQKILSDGLEGIKKKVAEL